ncbi:hypothetical protein NE237_026593 [Protea cynaroides]|uniref:Uncharacterized protein n=1 Tax=Protea cynaroides TaxID=273540 RepID=A0A9Q0H409_9MAGN|nr:hypothetical protein NE237_026593 [Protea cynaroides]
MSIRTSSPMPSTMLTKAAAPTEKQVRHSFQSSNEVLNMIRGTGGDLDCCCGLIGSGWLGEVRVGKSSVSFSAATVVPFQNRALEQLLLASSALSSLPEQEPQQIEVDQKAVGEDSARRAPDIRLDYRRPYRICKNVILSRCVRYNRFGGLVVAFTVG